MIYRSFILCFTLVMFMVSCSNDNEGDNDSSNNNAVEIPASDVTTYKGILFIADDPTESNSDAKVTLVESGDKKYSIIFDDDVPSITDLEFVSGVIDNVFTSRIEILENRGIAVSLITDSDGNRILNVAKEIEEGSPEIVFGGFICDGEEEQEEVDEVIVDDTEEEDCLPDFEILPENTLGVYTGKITNEQGVIINETGTVTIVETGCKLYTINFSDNISPPLIDVSFGGQIIGDVYGYIYTDSSGLDSASVRIEGSLDSSSGIGMKLTSVIIAGGSSSLIVFEGSK